MAENLLSPITSPPVSVHSPNPLSNFPIIAVAVIGICATAFLLVAYYIFVIKCCLNWHRLELLRRFSLSTPHQDPLINHSPPEPHRGLDSSVIRSIPLIRYLKPTDNTLHAECSVCLSEFQEDEQLRKIPNCCHLFHIDCIDVWLQNNSNCPLCRTAISTPFSGEPVSAADEFVVIELGSEHEPPPERLGSGEVSASGNSRRKLGWRIRTPKYGLKKMRSMDDDCIDMRDEDEQFAVQPIRRSFSMDSSGDQRLYLAVQEALQLQHNRESDNGVSNSPMEGSRVRRSFFSFGHGRRSRNAVLPIYSEP